MNSNKPSNTMAIIGLVIGGIGLLVAFIPYIGVLAILPGIIGLIIGVFSLLRARDDGFPQGLSIAVIVVSIIACGIGGYQFTRYQDLAENIKSELKEYSSCEEAEKDYHKVKEEMIELAKVLDSGKGGLKDYEQVAIFGGQLDHIQKSSDKLGCDFVNEEDFDLDDMEEPESASEEEADGETDQGSEEGSEEGVEEGNEEGSESSEEEG